MKKTSFFVAIALAADFLAKASCYPATIQDTWLTHALKTINYYQRVMWKTVLKYYDQEIGDTEFLDVMIRLIEGQMRRAWNEGMRAVGLDPAVDMKPQWEQVIKNVINSEFNYVLKLGNDIQRAKGLNQDVDKFRSRVELWVNRYTDMVNRAKVECGKEKKIKLKWKFGDTIHCPACLQLNGIVAYAKEWDNLDVRPQSPPNWALSARPEGCIGWRCQCEFIPTDERLTIDRDLKILHAVYGRGTTVPFVEKMPTKGGEGSGHFGHVGRPGEVGGSLPGGENRGEIQEREASDVLAYEGHEQTTTIILPFKDTENLVNAMSLDSESAKEMLKRTGYTKEQALKKVEEARKIEDETLPTRDLYIDENGNYKVERQSLHDQITEELLQKGTPSEDPQLFLTGGLPGAGKSRILGQPIYGNRLNNYIVLDSDNIKQMLANADGVENLGALAQSYHAEADDIMAATFQQAVEQNFNIGFDLTMKNEDKIISLIDSCHSMGYSVEVAYIDLSPEEAMTRAVGRYLEDGRFVDPIYIATHDNLNSQTAYAIRDLVESWRYWDNNVPWGSSPVLIDEAYK